MRVLIVEDEPRAVSQLEKLLSKINTRIEIIGKPDSVQSAVSWLTHNDPPALIFMDIQLADGISFEIFEQVAVQSPIIFTTAYDEYALKAFKVNSVDYLLKPIDEVQLAQALRKFDQLADQGIDSKQTIERINSAISMLTKKYKERFVTKVGEHLKFIDVNEILYFVSEEKVTFCHATDKRKYILDYTLEQIDQVVDPERFFRINRKYIVSLSAIQDMISHSNSRLKILLKACDDRDVIVARERVQDFKNWLDK